MNKLLQKCRELYDIHSAGGNMHIVLDDGNLEDDHILFSMERAVEEKDWLCIEIGLGLLRMTKRERNKLYKNYDLYA